MSHLLVDQDWVDFDVGVPIILPIYPAASAKFPSVQAELTDSQTLKFLTQSTSRWDTLYSSYLLMRYVASREFESKYKVVDARNELHIVSVATKCEKEANGLT